MDLGFSGEFSADEVDGAVGRDQRLGQAEDIDEDGTIELGSGRVFVDLVEGEESLVAEKVELALGLGVLLVGEGACVEGCCVDKLSMKIRSARWLVASGGNRR